MSLKASLSNSHLLSVRKLGGGPKYAIQNRNTMLIISELSFDFIFNKDKRKFRNYTRNIHSIQLYIYCTVSNEMIY